jgi:hypothetical protein
MKMSVRRQGRQRESVKDRIRVDKKVARGSSNELYGRMNTTLVKKTKKELLSDANDIAISRGIPKPKRLARRQRPVLIIWFCKHCPERAQPTPLDWSFESFESFESFDDEFNIDDDSAGDELS